MQQTNENHRRQQELWAGRFLRTTNRGQAAEPPGDGGEDGGEDGSINLNPKPCRRLPRKSCSWKPGNRFLRMWCWIFSENSGEDWWWKNEAGKRRKTQDDKELLERGLWRRTKGRALGGGGEGPRAGQDPPSLPHLGACGVQKAASGGGLNSAGTEHGLRKFVRV